MPSRKNKIARKRRGQGRPRQGKARFAAVARHRGLGDLEIADAYANTLNDPFECEGVRLGWGCLVPSSIATAYLRTTVTSNADGSLGIIALPSAKGLLQVYAGGAAVPGTTATGDATDQGAVTGSFGSGRIISIGIKAFPSIAATAAPGASFAGALVGQSANTLSGLAPNDLEAFPETQMGIGSNGATATGRPVDVTSFAFNPLVVNGNGWGGATNIPFSVPYVSFAGLPGAVPVVVEIVMNFEGLMLNIHSASGLGEGETSGTPASTSWSSIEQLWAYVKPKLIQVAKNTVSSAATLAGNTLASFVGRQIGMPMGRQLSIASSGRRMIGM